MIDVGRRAAIYRLHQEGMSLREISRSLQVSRQTVRAIIQQQGKVERKPRSDKKPIAEELLTRLYHQCDGWIQRIYERLREEQQIVIGYSTLTRQLRELGLSVPVEQRCDRVPDAPGVEMQHDTSVYNLLLGLRRTRLIASILYLRYSKRRYLKFYRAFNRFVMKCFLHEALMFWGHAAQQCVIDNTNWLACVAWGATRSSSPKWSPSLNVIAFGSSAMNWSTPNRKAGNERSFWTVETNFFPGRAFQDLADLNAQAKQWATVRMEQRPLTKARLIPAKLFEHEQAYLTRLPAYLPAPYREQERDIDQYGYIPFQGNHYWIPGGGRGTVKVLETAEQLRVFVRHECLIEYPLAPDGVRGQHIAPDGQPVPRYTPRPRRRQAQLEDRQLRAMGLEVADYLDFAVSQPGVQRHRFTRALWALSRKLTGEVFLSTIRRAHRFRIADLATLDRIAWLCLSQTDAVLPSLEVDEELSQRPAYQEGYLTDAPDLSVYDQWPATTPISDSHNDNNSHSHNGNQPDKEPTDEDIPW